MYGGLPNIYGKLAIDIGRNVVLEGDHTWAAGWRDESPSLSIGDDSYIGFQAQILVGTRVEIGRHVMVANRVQLIGFNSHPLDPIQRASHIKTADVSQGDIILEDYCWIGNNAVILNGVRVGKGAVVAAESVVTRDVPDLVVVAGNPATVKRKIDVDEAAWQRYVQKETE
jgi:acetyltransferase-like isoleucine patch superfamily enzyme